MRYITHHRFKETAVCGRRLNIPYGTELESVGDFIVTRDGIPVCFVGSENAKLHFSRNDDGRGTERGKLTYAIAYGRRRGEEGFRFTDSEKKLLRRNWSRFLRRDVDVILFNEAFFAAEPEELGGLAEALGIKIKN